MNKSEQPSTEEIELLSSDTRLRTSYRNLCTTWRDHHQPEDTDELVDDAII